MKKWVLIWNFILVWSTVGFAQTNEFAIGEIPADSSMKVKVLSYRLKGRTASGMHTFKIKEPFVAISRDLLQQYPLGSYLVLSDCVWAGTYKVLDKMGKRHSKSIDVFSKKAKKGITYCQCKPASKP